MPKQIKIEIEPDILKFARFCSGYDLDTAAKKTKIKKEILIAIESAKQPISLAQVKRIAGVYKMPIAYFLLEEAPKDIVIPKDFRIVYDSEEEKFSPDTMLAIRRARYLQSVANDLIGNFNYDFKKVSIDDDAEHIAGYLRSKIGISMQDQKKWQDSNAALNNWKAVIESMGIFIMQNSLPDADISAFSLVDQKPYVITLNSAEHVNRRIFSLFHEVGHILLHSSGICNVDNFSRNSYQYIKIEQFCNQFAASFLIPSSDFVDNDLVKGLERVPFDSWDFNKVKTIARCYKVSQEVIYRRFVQVGILRNDQYEKKRKDLMESFEEYKKINKKKVIIPQFRKIISKNGKAFTSLVLNSFYENRITLVDVADFLGTTSRHIADVEANL